MVISGLGIVMALTTGCGLLMGIVPPAPEPRYTEAELAPVVVKDYVAAYGWLLCLPLDPDQFSTTGIAMDALREVYGTGGTWFFDQRAGLMSTARGPQPMPRAREHVQPGDRVCYQAPHLAHAPPPPTPTPPPRCHIVAEGDTAWSIKEAFYARDGVGGRFFFDNRAGSDANTMGEHPVQMQALEHIDAGDIICYNPPPDHR